MMNKKEIFRKVGGIISDLTEQYQYLSDNFDDFNELELELFSANANFLNEHIVILKKYASVYRPDEKSFIPPVHEIKKDPEVRTVGPEISEPAPGIETPATGVRKQVDPEGALRFDFDHQADSSQPEKSLDELYANNFAEESERGEEDLKQGENVVRDPERVPAAPVVTSDQAPAPAPVVTAPVITSAPETVSAPLYSAPAVATATPDIAQAETVVNTVVIPEKNVEVESNVSAGKEAAVRTINDVISAQVSKSTVSTSYTRQTTDDLKAIISLNDKLMFIKDLFNGYSLAYSEAIEILNRFDSLEAAENFLTKNYAEKNNWAARQSSVEKFFKLLERRYAK